MYICALNCWLALSNTTNTQKRGGDETLSMAMAMACVEDTNDNGNGNGILANVEWDWIGWMNERIWCGGCGCGWKWNERTDGRTNGWMDGCVSERLGESRTWIFNELKAVPLRHALLLLSSCFDCHCCTHTYIQRCLCWRVVVRRKMV